MSTSTSTGHGGDPGREPSEAELRAAYEAQLAQLRVEHVLLDNVVMLINLGMRRTGMAPGTESERDLAQVRLAIESVRALLPQVEEIAPSEASQIRNALSQMQMAYVRIGGQPPAPGEQAASGAPAPGAGAPGATGPGGAGTGPQGPGAPGPGGPPPGPGSPPGGQSGPGPAQRSGRLWVPGQ